MPNGADAAGVAVDWGTTRLRAFLLNAAGEILDRVEASKGVQSVAAGGFAAVLEEVCGPWFAARPDLPVTMAGMVGSRNGWVEAPYVSCPCGAADLAEAVTVVPGSRNVVIVPGVDMRWPDGAYDVMRGEEVQAIGSGIRDGLICLPGTHSKWILMEGGAIMRFATFVTGELYAAVTNSFIGKLAEEPADEAEGHRRGAVAGHFVGGLSRSLFQARAQVLGGALSGAGVKPFLSALLVEQEIAGALDLFGRDHPIHLVAGPPQREVYVAAFAGRNIPVSVGDPNAASLAGLAILAQARA